MLCYECHEGTNGVHGKYGHALDATLKLEVQEKLFAKGYAESEVRQMMGGKIYGK